MKPCKDCGNNISDNAQKCPHCGSEAPFGLMYKLAMQVGLVIILGAMTFGLFALCVSRM